MADSNMTIGSQTGETISGKKSRLRKVVFTHTASGTAGGNATTTFTITGTLLRLIATGGDGAWNIVLNDGVADIYTSPTLTATATSIPLGIMWDGGSGGADTEIVSWGIPMVEQTLLCTTTNVSTTAPTITVIWEESDVSR